MGLNSPDKSTEFHLKKIILEEAFPHETLNLVNDAFYVHIN